MIYLTEKEVQLINKNFPLVIGQRLREIRKNKNVSQTELANLIGKDRQYVYKIEKGKVNPSISTIGLISYALQIELSEIFKDINLYII